MMKNLIGLILIVAFSSSVFGFAGGDGTESNPYQVSTVADLNSISDYNDACFIMVNDINLASVTYPHSLICHAWYDSGTLEGKAFVGTFDGDGYVIQNLAITDSDVNNVTGLFGCIGEEGVVKNLGIEGVNINSAYITGSLVAKLYGAVYNCYVSDDPNSVCIYSTEGFGVGGLIGTSSSSGEGTTIEDCWAAVGVKGFGQVGGLVGQIRARTKNCYATGQVEATRTSNGYAGGFAGCQYGGYIIDSYATGDVLCAGNMFGGFTGYQDNGNTISRCYSTGNVTGTKSDAMYGGGFVGMSDGATSLISQCYSTGDVYANTYNSQRIGGFAGQVINLFDSYATGDVTAYYGTGGLVGLAGLGNGSDYARIVRCYATGQVNGMVRPVAGFLAYNYGYAVTVVDCFWDTETSGTTIGIDYNNAGGAIGKTTAEMMTESTFTDAGWDFDNVWVKLGKTTSEYPGYPVLSWQVDLSVGDINKDGAVNFGELLIISDEWLSAETY